VKSSPVLCALVAPEPEDIIARIRELLAIGASPVDEEVARLLESLWVGPRVERGPKGEA
jgi:hypothetical protein